MRFMIAALLAAMTMVVHAQRQVCSISPPPRSCRIGDNQVCPGGCIRRTNCPTATSTATITNTATPVVTQSASTITSTVIITNTATQSASTVTVTASTSSTAPPACKTEVPYANLFTFPDNTCKNGTNFFLGNPSLPVTVKGLVGAPIKFSNLTYNASTKYNESSCTTLPTTDNGARSMYFTADGIPKQQAISCTMNLYLDNQCQGNGGSSPARFTPADQGACKPARLTGNAGLPANGPWRSVQFKCAYVNDLCTADERFLGTCNKF